MDIDPEENEPLLDGLKSLPHGGLALPGPTTRFREQVWQQTARVVHGRSRRRQFVLVGGLLLTYAAGIGTAHFVGGSAALPDQPFAEPMPGVSQYEAGEPADPAQLVRQATSAAPPERRQMLRKAGDLFLSSRMDVGGALRCYRELLKSESPSQQAQLEPGDSWLLVFLKNARQLEVNREKENG